jgi:hypothetical protein
MAPRSAHWLMGEAVRKRLLILAIAAVLALSTATAVIVSRLFRPFSRRGISHVAALTAVALLAATGCSTQQQHAARPATKSATVRVDPSHSATLHLPGGLEVSVPAGAVTRPGTLSATVTRAPTRAPSGMELAGPVYDLHLTGTTLKGTVRLTVPVPRSHQQGLSAGPNAALLVYYDSAAGRWQPVSASYNLPTHTLTATSPHLSKWSVLGLDAGQILATAASTLKGFLGIADTTQPSCPNSAQLAALGVKVASDPGDLVKWCAADNGTGAVIRVASNRSYAMEADYPSDWSMSRVGSLDPVTGQILKYLPALSLRVSGPNVRTVIIPGGQQVDVTQQTGTSAYVLISPSVEGIIVDALLYAVGTLAMTFGDVPGAPKPDPAETDKVISAVFSNGGCLAEMDAVAQNPDVSTPQAAAGIFRSFTDVAANCLGKYWPVVYGMKGPGAALWAATTLWLVDGIKLIIVDLHSLIDSAMYWQGYHIYVESSSGAAKPTPSPTASATPTCPSASAAYAVAIGPDCTKPTVLYFSSDLTVSIRDITWSSWDASGATGRGTWYLVNCTPSCANGPIHKYPATLTLSNTQNGLFTILTTTLNGHTTISHYPGPGGGDDWPQHT